MKIALFGKIRMNRKDSFFLFFEDMVGQIIQSADILTVIIDNPEKAELTGAFSTIKRLEAQADEIVHRVLAAVDSTINTPFDREDIQRLMYAMDDVIDMIYRASQQIKLYHPKPPLHQFRELNQSIVRGCEQLRIGIFELRNLKQSLSINHAREVIRAIEREADNIFHELISKLFETEKNPIELVKQKEILETLEYITDRIKDVSDVFKTIKLKAA